MNQIQIYQHPFVDVFKVAKINEWLTCHKEGDVQDNVWDKDLAKNYIRIQGATSSANYVQIPASKFLPKKALGLTGKWVYLILNKPEGKNCAIHLDYILQESRTARVSLSSLFKEIKNMNGTGLQIPLSLQGDRWTVVAIHVGELFDSNNLYIPNQAKSFYLRSLQICSSVNVRGVFTSDIAYQVQTLPKDMALKLPKDSDWFSHYNWYSFPQTAVEAASPEQAKSAAEPAKPTAAKVTVPSKKRAPGVSAKSKVKFEAERGEQSVSEANETTEAVSDKPLFCDEEQAGYNAKIERTMKDIEKLKEEMHFNLQAKAIEQTAEVKLYQDKSLYDPRFDPKNMDRSAEKFVLKPNPIMRLDRVVGWHPHNTCGQIYFNRDPKLSKEILFTQANLLLGFYPPLQKQRLFYERHTNNIDQLFVVSCANNKNYAFSVCRSLEEKSRDNEITIWSLDSLDTSNADSQSLVTFKPPMKSIHSVSISSDAEHLCLAGKDHQIRDVIIVYKFAELIKYQKVEIAARQLADFETESVKFSSCVANSIIAVGKENIKFYKMKAGHLPGQAVLLNNTARGKVFTNAVVQCTQTESAKTQKPNYVFVTSQDGLLYFINYNTRSVEKIIQIHEGSIVSLVAAPNNQYYVTASDQGVLRIWSTDFESLKSEVNTGNPISHVDVSFDSNQICVLSAQSGTISVLDLDHSNYSVVMRSHMDNITDLTYNQMTGKLVTVSEDYSVKVWHGDTMEQVNEFISENDKPIKVVSQNQGKLGQNIPSEDTDSLVAIGFKSGFLRILDLEQMKIVHETLLFQSPIMDIEFSLDNRFMAVFFKNGTIVIINKERPGEFLPVKNIDYELPNSNYCSLSFSVDSKLLANISSNANTITVWETRNFSLRYHLDLTGDIISKIKFAPNGKDLVVLTTSSKLKFYRLGLTANDTELLHVKDAYGVTDMECVDFQISANNRFIICAGKEGTIKVFDYFMRGDIIASYQAFMGHFRHASKVIISKDLRFVFSVGELNGIYKWAFYGDKTSPEDVSEFFEELESEKVAKAAMSEAEKEQRRRNEGMFDQEELMTYTQQQLEEFNSNLNQGRNLTNNKMAQLQHNYNTVAHQGQKTTSMPFQHTIDLNSGGYLFEQFDLKLSKLLACSNGNQVKNNIIWNIEQRYMAYTCHNILVIESLNQEKTQRLIKEGNDQLFQLKFSPSKQYLLAFSKFGPIDGFPCIFIFDSVTFKKLNQIAISDAQIDSVEFSWLSNMLLVVSSTKQGDEVVSTLTVWDFIDGHKDIFCKSMVPIRILESQWNPYVQKNSDEFVTISERCYHYWRITENLQLQYQEGEMPQKQTEGFRDKTDQFTTLTFVKPDKLHHSVYLLIGTKTGFVWVTDTRTNQFLFNVKVLEDAAGGVNRIFSSHARIVIESINAPTLHCWDQSGRNGDKEYSAYNPFNFFMGVESKLSIDGNVKSSFYDDTGSQQFLLSTSGSIWYLSWIENVTLRLKYCHNPQQRVRCADFKYVSPSEFSIQETQDDHYQFDQNYQIATSSSDGNIKLWNMHDIEYAQQFIVPKEECIYIAMHQFKPYMVSAFTDGYLRFFDLDGSKLLGRCQIHSGIEDPNPKNESEALVDYVVSIKILPSGNHIFAATKNGQVVLIFVNSWSPLSIKIESIVSIQTSINSFDFSYLEPYNKWLVATANGKVIVYNRKDFNSLNQEIFDINKPPQFNFMDSFNALDYASNSYMQTQRCNTLDHYYSMAKRNLVYNEVNVNHECEGVFANNDLTLHLSFIRMCNQLFIRNFELHQVIRRIEMSSNSLPRSMQLMPSVPFVCVTLQDNTVKLIDFMNEANQASIQTLHEELTSMKVCPNGRYILTAGNRGDVCLWSVNKRILAPEAMRDAVRTDAC